jgi:hypothetical protein
MATDSLIAEVLKEAENKSHGRMFLEIAST